MKKVLDYVRIYDHVFSKDFCENLIGRFDENESLYIKRDDDWDSTDHHNSKSFDEINLTEYPQVFKEPTKEFYDTIKLVKQQYEYDSEIEYFPSTFGYEETRLKKYNINGKDQFGRHVDVGDYASARRFLVMFVYLNTVTEGGETVFYEGVQDNYVASVRPQQGSVVCFPPFWNYPHAGLPTVSNPKYILSTYLHYI